jgi:hypothetical protein
MATEAWAALLGAVVGGLFTLSGALLVELRRDRRNQIGSARLVIAELERSALELDVIPELVDHDNGWVEGPHPKISTGAWVLHASDLVGRLSREDFDVVDRIAAKLTGDSEFGFTLGEARAHSSDAKKAAAIIAPIAKPSWFDRHIWRL